MNMHIHALISVLMFSFVSSQCFQITGSNACAGFSGSFVSSTKDFNDVGTMDSFVLKRVGQANTNQIYIKSFRSSYGCPNYQGDKQEHLQTMFCAQLVAGSLPACKKDIAVPLCLDTCQSAIQSLVSIFRSNVCSMSNTDPNFEQIKANRDVTVKVYHNLCYNSSITSQKPGCIIDVANPSSVSATGTIETPLKKSPSTNAPIAGAQKAAAIQELPDTSNQSPISMQAFSNEARQRQDSNSSSVSQDANSSSVIQDANSSSVSQDANSNTPTPSTGNDSTQLETAIAEKALAGSDEKSLETKKDDEESLDSPPTATKITESGPASNNDVSEPPPAVVPNIVSVTDSGSDHDARNSQNNSESGSTNSNSLEGGSVTENKTMLWAIIGTSIALILAILIGVLIYRSKNSEDSENPFKGTNSLGSYGSSSNNLATSSDGIVCRPYYPELPDEVALNVGDRVEVLEAYDDGWALGDNVNTGLRGVFPLQCIESMAENGGNPASPSSRVSSLYGINKYYRKA